MPPEPLGTLDASALQFLREYVREVSYPPGSTIIHRGDEGRRFFVVVSGDVEILLGDDNPRLCLAHLGVGSSFGEMSLLTGAPVSADVVAQSEAMLLEFSADDFQEAMAQFAPLRGHVLTRLANDLNRTSAEAWGRFQHAEALSALLHAAEGKTGPLVGESTQMRRVQKRIAEFGKAAGPLLVAGEPGTGKFFLARKVHEAGEDPDAPLILVDCEAMRGDNASRIIFGARDATDFGQHLSSSGPETLEVRGALHLADGGTLILRHIEDLDRKSQEILSQYIDVQEKGEELHPQTRLIMTSSADLELAVKDEGFSASLQAQLTAKVLKVPRLRDHKKDILPLALHFLSQCPRDKDRPEWWFNKSAEHTLLSMHYRHRNVEELREAVQFAALIADDPELDSVHVFSGPKQSAHSIEYDLKRSGFVQRFVESGALRVAQGTVLAFFMAIIALCFIAHDSATGRFANALVWGLWWPSLMVLFLFLGRVWCVICPISTVGRIARTLKGMNRKVPAWVKNRSPWIVAFLFMTILWCEHVFHMLEAPVATGFLLLSLMALSAAFCVVYEREVWCRYLCPLGSLGAAYSVSSMIQIRATQGVCSSQCTTAECYKGSETNQGCPMFHHPLNVSDAHFCKLCFACIRNCPHQSPKVYVRPLLQGVWRLDELSSTLVPFAMVEVLLGIIMLASPRAFWGESAVWYTVVTLLAFGAAFLFSLGLPRLVARDHDATLTSRTAFALLILGWGPFMAFHVEHIPGIETLYVSVMPLTTQVQAATPLDVSLLIVLQVGIIALAAVFAALSLWRIWAHSVSRGVPLVPWRWGLLSAMCAVYLAVAAALVTFPGTPL